MLIYDLFLPPQNDDLYLFRTLSLRLCPLPFQKEGKFSFRYFLVSRFFHVLQINQSLTFRRRKALLMTVTELRLMAAPAMIGLSSRPKNG